MFTQYPYLNINDLNLDFILKAIREMKYEVTNFVSINAIKYADPIQWNITSQYEKNTIVIDPVTGTAYISVAPVPSGVSLTRPEYWTVVFDLGSFVTRAAQNFTSHWESETTTTATFPTTTGGWLVWGDVLYKALTNITAGDTYVVGSNIEHFTIEDLYNAYLNTIANVLAMIGNLTDLTTSDTTNIVHAINSVLNDLNVTIGDLDNLNTSDKSSAVAAINEIDANVKSLRFVTPEDFGAVGDGVADDTAAVQDALNSDLDVMFNGTYLITSDLIINHNASTVELSRQHLYGNGVIILRDCSIKGNATYCGGLDVIGLTFTSDGNYATYAFIVDSKLIRCKFICCKFTAIDYVFNCDTSGSDFTQELNLIDSVVDKGVTGFTFGGSNFDCLISRCRMNNFSNAIVDFLSTNNFFVFKFSENTCENSGYVLKLNGAFANMLISDNYFERNTTAIDFTFLETAGNNCNNAIVANNFFNGDGNGIKKDNILMPDHHGSLYSVYTSEKIIPVTLRNNTKGVNFVGELYEFPNGTPTGGNIYFKVEPWNSLIEYGNIQSYFHQYDLNIANFTYITTQAYNAGDSVLLETWPNILASINRSAITQWETSPRNVTLPMVIYRQSNSGSVYAYLPVGIASGVSINWSIIYK